MHEDNDSEEAESEIDKALTAYLKEFIIENFEP